MTQRMIAVLSACSLFFAGQVLCFAQATSGEKALDELRARLRKDEVKVSSQFEKLVTLANRDIQQFNRGHVIFGQVIVEGENASKQVVVSQMSILPGGYFIDAAGAVDKPIGFRIHGYEPVDVSPKGPGPVEDLGVIHIKPLPADRLASAKGQVMIESRAGAPRLDEIVAEWTIDADPVNSATGGRRGSPSITIKSKVGPDGKFSISGLSPAKYTVDLRAPNCGVQFRRVTFTEKESKELEPFTLEVGRKIDIEFAVSTNLDFRNSKVSKASLAANQSWLSTGDKQQEDEDLFIRQKNKKLVLSSSRQPFILVDLGAAELNEKLNLDPGELDLESREDIPAENGHVYLLHHDDTKRWVLIRTTLNK